MYISEIVKTLDEILETRPANPEWWANYGNEAISQAIKIIKRWQKAMSVEDWVDPEHIRCVWEKGEEKK